ncbi:MAG: hypothetical protein ACM3KK_00010 [Bacteroidales bacterium]
MVIKLKVTEAMVRRCMNISILKDKKLRERRIEHDKCIIMLDENTPFSKYEQLKLFVNQALNRY